MARNYYIHLYSTEMVCPWDPSDWKFPQLDPCDSTYFSVQCIGQRVPLGGQSCFFFQMGATKASGPDALPPIFFQWFWDIVGPAVTDFSLWIFSSGVLPPILNESIICLILKVEAPESLNQFRHISLCNVLVKAISKMLANRLKPLMDKLIGHA